MISEKGMIKIRENGKRTIKILQKLREERELKKVQEYINNPKRCLECDNVIPFDKRNTNRYCGHSCSAKVNNAKRSTRIISNKFCCFCGKNIVGRSSKKYCNKCQGQHTVAKNVSIWEETGVASKGVIINYLLQIQNKSCAICSKNLWNGLQIPLELDHIDGNSENDRKDNVRLVCPNCHAQTPFYKSKNRGNGRYNRRIRYKEGKSY